MQHCRPSPARYTLPTTVGYNGHDIRKQRLPAYSFGLRVPDQEKIHSPGPNTYGLPSTMTGKDKTIERNPAHTMHGRFNIKDHVCAPGPNTYGLQNFKYTSQRAPAYSLGAKIPPLHQTTEC